MSESEKRNGACVHSFVLAAVLARASVGEMRKKNFDGEKKLQCASTRVMGNVARTVANIPTLAGPRHPRPEPSPATYTGISQLQSAAALGQSCLCSDGFERDWGWDIVPPPARTAARLKVRILSLRRRAEEASGAWQDARVRMQPTTRSGQHPSEQPRKRRGVALQHRGLRGHGGVHSAWHDSCARLAVRSSSPGGRGNARMTIVERRNPSQMRQLHALRVLRIRIRIRASPRSALRDPCCEFE